MPKRQEVLTIAEVAELLRIPRSSVYKLAQDGRIPCQKAGRQWRFSARAIEDWLSACPGSCGNRPASHPCEQTRDNNLVREGS